MRVEVTYALPQQQYLLVLEVAPGCTALEALQQSGLIPSIPGFDPATASIGVFGKLLEDPAGYVLAEGDRVEVYRPLTVEPRDARRQRARTRR